MKKFNSIKKKLNILTPTQGVTIGVNPTTVRDPEARYTARYEHGTRTDQARYQARYKHGTRHGTSTEQARYTARYKHRTSTVPGMVQARNKHGANKKSVCGQGDRSGAQGYGK